jgi:hypothetical protein
MGANTDERLERAITIIEELSALVRTAGFAQSELFLEMAKLQLQLDLHGITDEEFGAFCDALESRKFTLGPNDRTPAHARPRRNGDLRLMRRAWRHPQDPLPQRGGARAGR